MIKKVIRYFKKTDPILYQTIHKGKPLEPISKSHNFFSDLCETIISQQLSEKAGMTISNRFKRLFPKEKITAAGLLKLSDEKMRSVGTSGNKIKFMKELAKKVHAKEVNLEKFERLENEAVIKELTQLKGVGRWTAEMFLMFSLAREDVFSYGDLGLRRAIQKLYTLPKKPTLKQAEKISKKWSPYRTYACRILWRSIDSE